MKLKHIPVAVLASAALALSGSAAVAADGVEGYFGDNEKIGAPLSWSGGTVNDAALMELVISGEIIDVYCINNRVMIPGEHHPYREADWESYNNTDFRKNSGKIAWIVGNGYPQVSVSALASAAGVDGLTEREAITATQVTLWQLVDESSLNKDYPGPGNTTAKNDSSKRMQGVIDWFFANATDEKEPSPTVSLSSAQSKGPVGTTLGPINVTTTAASVSVSAIGGTVVDADGDAVSSAKNGSELWLKTSSVTRVADGDTATVKAVSPEASLYSGRVFVSATSVPSQELITAKTSKVKAAAEVTFELEPYKASVPNSTPSETSSVMASPRAGETTETPGDDANTTAPDDAETTDAPVAADEGGLASTGASPTPFIAVGLLLLAAGALALWVRRNAIAEK